MECFPSSAKIAIVYPESGYPVEEFNGLPCHVYFSRRAYLLQTILRNQYGLDTDVLLLKNNNVNNLGDYSLKCSCKADFFVEKNTNASFHFV